MAQPDVIGVNKPWMDVTLTEAANVPAIRQKALQRLAVMRREAEHAIRAIDAMKSERSRKTPFPSTGLSSALKQSRDWVLSVAQPHNKMSRSGSLRLFRFLLWLYPAAFREDYERELQIFFRGQLEAEGAVAGGIACTLRAAAGIIRNAPKENMLMLGADLRHAFRFFRRQPGFTAVIEVKLTSTVRSSNMQ